MYPRKSLQKGGSRETSTASTSTSYKVNETAGTSTVDMELLLTKENLLNQDKLVEVNPDTSHQINNNIEDNIKGKGKEAEDNTTDVNTTATDGKDARAGTDDTESVNSEDSFLSEHEEWRKKINLQKYKVWIKTVAIKGKNLKEKIDSVADLLDKNNIKIITIKTEKNIEDKQMNPRQTLTRAAISQNRTNNNENGVKFWDMTESAIQEESEKISKSAISLLEALLLSEIVSIKLLTKECGSWHHLANVDADDDTTIYVGKCFEDTYEWISRFNGQCQSERTVDMFLIGSCAKTPQTIFTYGENHSDADREDKITRSQNSRVGKSCDFLYWSSSREGIGENSGPTHKDNHDKARTSFIDVIKVSRAQHIKHEIQMIERSGRNPLPESLQKAMTSILIPFFHIIGMRIRFYLFFQISGDLYGIWDWASEYLPTKNADVGEIALLCKRFLVHENLIEHVGRMTNILAKKSKTFKDKKDRTSESSQPTVVLNKFRTPTEKNSAT
ncbi:hypothetical protein Glove_421g119 [Diversispora epigaea]|uniref:Uncharacterized protein n=1 Tax=Diversispora epigaea TaxID=1348612 RepID=A0A397GVA4_9GLOM|nr:hypothetical protein Glove_421g119 [Diversispora epigaea]